MCNITVLTVLVAHQQRTPCGMLVVCFASFWNSFAPVRCHFLACRPAPSQAYTSWQIEYNCLENNENNAIDRHAKQSMCGCYVWVCWWVVGLAEAYVITRGVSHARCHEPPGSRQSTSGDQSFTVELQETRALLKDLQKPRFYCETSEDRGLTVEPQKSRVSLKNLRTPRYHWRSSGDLSILE